MAITNVSKPGQIDPVKLNIGDGFNLLIGGVYNLFVGSGQGLFTNTTKASIGETWDTWTTAWDDETKTWLALSQLIDNEAKPTTTVTNQSKP